MSTDPEILSSSYVPGDPPPKPPVPPPPFPVFDTEPYARPRRIPNIGHTILFFMVAIIVLLLTSVSAFALVMGLHLLGPETADQLLREPRLLIPSMAVGYLIAGAILWAIFTHLWQQPFPQALHWNFSIVRRHWVRLLRRRRCLEPGGPVPVEFPSDSQDAPHRRLLSISCRRVDGGPVWHLAGPGL